MTKQVSIMPGGSPSFNPDKNQNKDSSYSKLAADNGIVYQLLRQETINGTDTQ